MRSLRVIFFIIIFLVGVVPCTLLQNAILRNYEERAVEVRVEQVKEQLRSLANHLINSNYLVNNESGQVDAELSEFATLYDGRLLIIDTTLTVVKDTYGLSENKTIVSQDVISCLRTGDRGGSENYDRKYGFIEIVIPIMETRFTEGLDYTVYRNDDDNDSSAAGFGQGTQSSERSQSNAVRGVLLASTSTEYIQRTKEILRNKAMNMQWIMLVVVFIASILLSRMLVWPFEILSRDISEVKEGYSNEPIAAPMYTETRHIADAFNNVLGRMNALDQSRQEFVANVSHELKTPMTSMKVLAASLLSEENVDPAVYREFLEDIDSEIDRENKIISDLLALVKEDRTNIDLEVTRTDINALAEAVMKRMRPIAELSDIALTLVNRQNVYAEVDFTRISLALTNLVENAIKYNHEHGEVTVTVDSDDTYFWFIVEDNGIGIPEEDLARIYERFFRVDKSRSREIGGTGLGLSITKSAILRHHGTISVESKEGEGTTFTVRIPLQYSAQPMELRVGKQRRQISRLLQHRKNDIIQKKYFEKTIHVSRRRSRPGTLNNNEGTTAEPSQQYPVNGSGGTGTEPPQQYPANGSGETASAQEALPEEIQEDAQETLPEDIQKDAQEDVSEGRDSLL